MFIKDHQRRFSISEFFFFDPDAQIIVFMVCFRMVFKINTKRIGFWIIYFDLIYNTVYRSCCFN